jgi:hypothetical protein
LQSSDEEQEAEIRKMFNEDSLFIDEKSKEAVEHKFGFTDENLQ